MSQQQYLSQLRALNPQIANVDDGLIPGDEVNRLPVGLGCVIGLPYPYLSFPAIEFTRL